MLATRAADASCALVYVNQVGGQDELVFDGASLVFDADGDCVARAEQFVETTLVVDIDVVPVFRKRLLDPRGRATAPDLPVVEVSGDRADHDDRRPPDDRGAAADGARGVRGAGARHARLRREERLHRRRARPVGRHRLVAGHGHRRRRDRRRPGARRRAAVALLVRGLDHRRRAAVRQPRRRVAHIPIEPAYRGDARAAGAVVRRASSPTSPRRTCKAASGPRC